VNADPNLPTCAASAVTASTVVGAKKLGKAVKKLLPASAPACTEGVTVDVKLGGKGKTEPGSLTVMVSSTGGEAADDDSLVLTCLPRAWPYHNYDHFNRRSTERTTIKPKRVADLAVKWEFEMGHNVTATPTVGETLVYAGSWNGTLYAIDRETGLEAWSYDTGSGDTMGIQGSATLTPDGRVLIGDSEAVVHCLDAATGAPLWQRNVEILPQDHVWGSITVVDNRALVPIASDGDTPCTKGRVEALDLDTGTPLWTARTAPDRVCEDDSTEGCSVDADCTTGRCVGMCAGDRGIACVDDAECGADGPCQDVIGGGVTATPAADTSGATMFMASVGCYTGPRVGNADRIFRVDAASGAVEWALPDFPPEAFGSSAPYNDYGFLNGPIVVNGKQPMLIAASKDGKIYAVDPATGAEIWTNTVGDVTQAADAFAGFGLFNGHPALLGKTLFASLNAFFDGTPTGIVHTQAFKFKTGAHQWDAELDIGNTWGVVSAAGGVVYVGKGALSPLTPTQFHAFDAKKGKLLRTFELPAQTSSGPSIVDDELFIGYGLSLFGPAIGGVRAYELP
jgi:outer membrane protein assembly factor BamB